MYRIISPLVSRLAALALLLALPSPSIALQPGFFGDTADEPAATLRAEEPLPAGTVVAVDAAHGRLTLDYRPVPRLFLEGGTRVFDVVDSAMLKGLSAGDRVRFEVERDGRRYVVTRLENRN